MAAGVAIGLAAGLAIGMLVGVWVTTRLHQPDVVAGQQAALSPELMETLFVRLLDASIPVTQAMQDDEAKVPTHEVEYEPPEDEVLDWTDPFIGMERPLVARLAPGESIPGMGDSVYDQWLREDEDHVAASWVEPVQLDDETRVE